jgi:hypothetical protein
VPKYDVERVEHFGGESVASFPAINFYYALYLLVLCLKASRSKPIDGQAPRYVRYMRSILVGEAFMTASNLCRLSR